MANSFWNFVTQFVPNSLAKAEDLNTNFSGIQAGLDLVEVQTLQAVKITNSPGVVNISATPDNRKNKIMSFDNTGGVTAAIYIGNYKGNHVAVAGTVYNLRDTVKDSTGALGLNNLYICSATHTSTGTLLDDTANWDIILDSASAAASAAAALVSETNAAASFDAFDDRELGSKAADPTLDNDGNALLDGAQYWNTVLKRKKIYDLTNTLWKLTTADAIDVNVTDTNGLVNAANTEVAIQELAAAAIGVTSTGTSSSLVLTYGLPNAVVGDMYTFTASIDIIASVTLNVDGAGAKAIITEAGDAIQDGDIILGGVYKVRNITASWVLVNPSRSNSKLSAKDTLQVGSSPDLTHLAGTIPFAIGRTGLVTGDVTNQVLSISNNSYVDSAGNDTVISTGASSSIVMNQSTVKIFVAPSSAGAPISKTPISIDVSTGVITVGEPIGFQSVYEKPALTAGTAAAYTATIGITSLVNGTVYKVRAHINNTGAATLTLDGLATLSIVLSSTASLIANDIDQNAILELYYNGTNLTLLNPNVYTAAFSPTLLDTTLNSSEGQTYVLSQGIYTKDAQHHINYNFYMAMSSLGTLTTTDQAFIGGFPYPQSASVSVNGARCSYAANFNMATAGDTPVGHMPSGASYIELRKWGGVSGTAPLLISEVSSNGFFYMQGEYYI